MRLPIIIILFILLAQVQGASAHFTIDDQKFLVNSTNGQRIYPIGIDNICHWSADGFPQYHNCSTSLDMFNNFTYTEVTLLDVNNDYTYTDSIYPILNAKQIYAGWTESGAVSSLTYPGTARINNPMYFGYYLLPNEAYTAAQFQLLYDRYNQWKTYETTHPIRQANLYWNTNPRNYSMPYNVSDFTDIWINALYTYKTNCVSTYGISGGYYILPDCTQLLFNLSDWLYWRDRETRMWALDGTSVGSGINQIDNLPVPYWQIESATGENYYEGSGFNTPIKPPLHYRVEIYHFITMGAKGVVYWAAKLWNPTKYVFLDTNTTQAKLVNDVIGEFTSPEIQSIITLNTSNYSWRHPTYAPWDNKVTFSNNPSKNMFGTLSLTLSYRLYHNDTRGKDYLIVVNKGDTNITTTITIANLTGTKTWVTLGLQGTGSAAPGRNVVITNGVFTDTFSPYAAHVYEITESGNNSIPPILSSCSATNTSSLVNVSCTGGSGNITNSIRVYNVNTSTWNNVSTMYALNSGLNSGTAYTFRAYPYNNSGTGEINNTYTTVLGTTTQAESAAAFTIKGSGGNATWSSFTQNNVTEDLGSHGIKVGIFADNFEDINHNWITRSGTPTVTASSGYLILEKLLSENVWISPASNNNTTNLNLAFSVQFKDGLNREIRYFNRYLNSSNLHYSSLKDSSFRFWNVINGASTILNAQDTITPSQDIWYNIRSRFIGNAETVWVNNVEKYSYTDNNLTQNPWGFGLYNGTSWIDNVRSWNTQSGNFTSWYDAGANVTYQVVVNATTPTNTNYSVLYRQNATGDYVSLASAQTGNTTHAITTKYQNTDVRVVLNGNETETPELIAVTYYAQAPVTYAPNITSWSNTKTNNNTANFTSNVSESVTFNATANQTITTWNWYVNGTNQNINYDNISLSYSTAGTRLIQVNATNSNGTSNTISWNMTVLTPSTKRTYGIGGEFFQNKTIGSNKTCINQGDGAIGVGLLCDNFNDNNTDGWNETGYDSTWTPVNGVVNQSTATTSYLYRNVTSYENMSMFTKFKEYGSLLSYIDVVDLRGNLSRIDPTYGIPAYMTTQFSMGAINQTRAYIYSYDGYDWRPVNTTIEKTRYLGDWNYVYFAGYGTTFKGYHSNVSHSNALASVLVSGTNNTWLNGTTIQFGGRPESGTIISWDEIRAVELDALGNQYLQGNYSMNYTVPASQYAKNITINGTYASGTNYSLQYRQNATGDYIAVEGIKTANSTIELPTPYYQNIDMILEMNSTESDTLWIQNISVGASETDGSITDYTKAIIGWWD